MPDARVQQFQIKRSDRVFLVGSTGSGKTSLAKALLYGLDNVIVLDPKRTFTLPADWPHSTYTDLSEMTRAKGPETRIYRPDYEELEGGCDDLFIWIFERRNTTILIDEVMEITNGPRWAGKRKGYQRLLQQGRERGVSTWSATQRPANIPLAVATESEHWFVFRLRASDDRDRLYKNTGQPAFLTPPRDEHGFYYYNERNGRTTYYRKAKLGKAGTV